MSANHWTRIEALADGRHALRCTCGWSSLPAANAQALGHACGSANYDEHLRQFGVVRVKKTGDRYYRLHPNNTATLAPQERPIAATEAYYRSADDENEHDSPLLLWLVDGRCYIVVLLTCDNCGESYESGVTDALGRGYCDIECLRAHREAI